MLLPSTKRVGKLLGILLITINAYSQNKNQFRDSALLKKEIDSVLAKYGLKSKGFVINVISLNQQGGQTAYSITNNYTQYLGLIKQRHANENGVIDSLIKWMPNKNAVIYFIWRKDDKESSALVKELQDYLSKAGYKNFNTSIIAMGDLGGNDEVHFRAANDSNYQIRVYPQSPPIRQ